MSEIDYSSDVESISSEMLSGGFFAGWPTAPSAQMHLQILRGSSFAVMAIENGRVVGFITAITDGVLAAYIPLLEVLPVYRGRGIGSALVSRMLEKLSAVYMVDVVCDAEIEPFYTRFSMARQSAMSIRAYDRLRTLQ